MNKPRWAFLVELAFALTVAIVGAFVADRFSRKDNRRAQAEERIAAALERAYPPPKELPRPSLLDVEYNHWCFDKNLEPIVCELPPGLPPLKRRQATEAEIKFIEQTPGCLYEAAVSVDGKIYPEHCRQ